MVEGLAMLHKIPPSSHRLPVLGRIPPKRVRNQRLCDDAEHGAGGRGEGEGWRGAEARLAMVELRGKLVEQQVTSEEKIRDDVGDIQTTRRRRLSRPNTTTITAHTSRNLSDAPRLSSHLGGTNLGVLNKVPHPHLFLSSAPAHLDQQRATPTRDLLR
eukprot:330044-Hanusia_phi.AAC.7